MKRLLAFLLACLLPVCALAETNPLLDAAFSLLEEGNPVVENYNTFCGGSVTARFQYGLPYFYGGTKEDSWLKPRFPAENSNYYKTDRKYLHGFDCINFVRWVYRQNDLPEIPKISTFSESAKKKYLVDTLGLSADRWTQVLQVGDLLGIRGGSYHIMMYIGTLADFGFTYESAPELTTYLNYPLFIHCGMNNFHTGWYTKYMEENGITGVYPPDGGVTISILGAPVAAAPHSETLWQNTANERTFYWFDLCGYNLTVYDVSGASWALVYRNR